MSKKARRVKRYKDGYLYEGWMERGKRVYLGRLFIHNNKICSFNGMWSNDILLKGYFLNSLLKTKVYMECQTTFDDLLIDFCSICLENMASKDCTLLKCQHIFCLDCISELFLNSNKCLLCRAITNQFFRQRILNRTELFIRCFS